MKKILLILTLLSCFWISKAQDTPPHIPPIVRLQTPNNATFWWNPLDSSVWVFKGSYGWTKLADSARVYKEYVPYIGAHKEVNLDTISIRTRSVKFLTNLSNSSYLEGKLFYDSTKHSLAYFNESPQVSVNPGRELLIRVYNNTADTIKNGTAVYPTGHMFGEPTIGFADAAYYNKTRIFALTTQDIAPGSFGYVTKFGEVGNLNTSMYSPSEILYVGHRGAVTNLLPSHDDFVCIVGAVGVSDATHGTIVVDTKSADYSQDVNLVRGWDNYMQGAEVTVSFRNSNRTLLITPIDTVFHYYQDGEKYLHIYADSLQISNDEGKHFVYYQDSTLTEMVNPSRTQLGDLYSKHAAVASIYWDATNQKQIMMGNERHTINMQGVVQGYLHQTRWTQYVDGYTPLNVVTDNGSLNIYAQFGIDSGTIADEDIQITSSSIASTVGLPIYYRSGLTAWRRTTRSGFSVLNDPTTGLVQYNKNTAGSWSLASHTDNYYGLIHVYAGNDLGSNKVFVIMGEGDYASKLDAENGMISEVASIKANFPFAEGKHLFTFVYSTKLSYANTPKMNIELNLEGDPYYDFRTTSEGGGASGGASGSSTSFLSLTDTPSNYSGQSNKLLGVTSTESGVEFKDITKTATGLNIPTGQTYQINSTPLSGTNIVNTPSGNISSINVQSAINELDTEKTPKTTTLSGTSPIRIDGGNSADLSANRTVSILAASGSSAGSMSASDKTKLDNITGTNTGDQNISTTGAAGNISISNGSTLNLNVDDADHSVTNEGSLSVVGTTNNAAISSNTSGSNTLNIKGGSINSVGVLGNDITITGTEVDGSVSNEGVLGVNVGSSTSSVITSNTSGSNGVTVNVGSGLSISETTSTNGGDITLTNTSPDQIVSLASGSGIAVSGTYPDFTITNSLPNVTTDLSISGTSSPLTLNSSDGTDVTITAGTGISLAGTSSNMTITNSSPDTYSSVTKGNLTESVTGLQFDNTRQVIGGSADLSLTPGYIIPTTTEESNWNTAYLNRITSLTTTGSSGASTLISNVLNIPNYTLSGLGGQPQLNGTGFVKANGTTISYDPSTYEPAFSKNTAFNKNFGTTPGTVLEGRTFGTASNSNTGDFIQNQNSAAQSGNFWINGTGKANIFEAIQYNVSGVQIASSNLSDGSNLAKLNSTNNFSVSQTILTKYPQIYLRTNDDTMYGTVEFKNSVGNTMGYLKYNFATSQWGIRAGGSGEQIQINAAGNITTSGSMKATTATYTSVGTTTATSLLGIDSNGLLTTDHLAINLSSFNNDLGNYGGFLTSELDPIFMSHTVHNISNGIGFLKNDGLGNWSYDNNTYLTSYTETDPIFVSSLAHNITAADTTRWGSSGASFWSADTYGINYTNNVGIGASSLSANKLYVTNSVASDYTAKIYNSNTSGIGLQVKVNHSSQTKSAFVVTDSSNNNALDVTSSGLLKVKTTFTPATPPYAGYGYLYAKTAGKIYFMDYTGTEYDLTASASGGGTVTSVGLSSSDFAVSGSPVTTSGTITANLNTSGVTAGSYSNANITVNSKGIITAASTGSSGGGNVYKVGTPVNNQFGVWTGDGTIKGDPNLTWDGVTMIIKQGGTYDPELKFINTDAPSHFFTQYFTNDIQYYTFYNGATNYIPLQATQYGIRSTSISLNSTSIYEDVNGAIRYNGSDILGKVGGVWYSLTAGGSGGSGTVTSVGLSMPSIFSVTGSPVTSSGTLTASLASQTSNLVFASPNGVAGTPTFRKIVVPDISATGTPSTTTYLRGDGAWATPSGAGTVTSVSMSMENVLYNTSVAGSPITGSGTFYPTLKSQSANVILASPNGTTGTPTFRKLVISDISATGTPGSTTYLRGDGTWSTVSSGSSNWTLSGSDLYPNSTSTNVAIGSTSASGYKLYVSGDTRINNGQLSAIYSGGASVYSIYNTSNANIASAYFSNSGTGGGIYARTTGGGVSGQFDVTTASATPSSVLRISKIMSGTPAVGDGALVNFDLSNSSGGTITANYGSIGVTSTKVTAGSESGKFILNLKNNGTLTQKMEVNEKGYLNLSAYGDTSILGRPKVILMADSIGNMIEKGIVPYELKTNPDTLDTKKNLNAVTTVSSNRTIRIMNLINGTTGNIEVKYSGTSVITFIVSNSLTLYIASNIYNTTTNSYTKSVISKSSGNAMYSYYVSGTNVYINGEQNYQ